MMRDYEGIFIVQPGAEKEELNRLVTLIGQAITKQGGSLTRVDLWGRRPLGHRIQRQAEGQFIYVIFQMDPSKVTQFEQSIQLQEEILKAMVTRFTAPAAVVSTEKGGKDGGS